MMMRQQQWLPQFSNDSGYLNSGVITDVQSYGHNDGSVGRFSDETRLTIDDNNDIMVTLVVIMAVLVVTVMEQEGVLYIDDDDDDNDGDVGGDNGCDGRQSAGAGVCSIH